MNPMLAAKLALEAEITGPLDRAALAYIKAWLDGGGMVQVRARLEHQHAFETLLVIHFARVCMVVLGRDPDWKGDLGAAAVNRRHADRLRTRATNQSLLIMKGIDRELAKAQIAGSMQKSAPDSIETKESFGSFTIRMAANLVNAAKNAYESVKNKIPSIANVQTQGPAEEAVIEWVDDNKDADSTVINVWSTMLDERVRHAHQEAEGQERRVDQPFDVMGEQLRFPGDTSLGASLGNVINCFIGETKVSGDILAATRHSYTGDVVEITTASGNKLTGTPNHPILTSEGWVALGSLNKGSHVVSSRASGDVEVSITATTSHALDVNRVEPSIEQVFDALNRRSIAVGVESLAVNFHGDRPTEEVEIVRSDCVLRYGVNAEVAQHVSQLAFAASDLDKRFLLPHGLALLLDCAGLGSSSGHVRAGNDLLPTIEIGLAHSEIHGTASVAGLDATLVQPSSDDGTRHTEVGGQSLFRHSVGVFLDEIVDINVEPVVGRHVYNLETVHGLFVAQGVVSHNCRCSAVFYAVDAFGRRHDMGVPTPRVPTRPSRRPGKPSGLPKVLQPTELVTLNGTTSARIVLGNGKTIANMRQTSPSTIEILVNRRVVARASTSKGEVTSIAIDPAYQSMGIADLIKRSVAHSFNRGNR